MSYANRFAASINKSENPLIRHRAKYRLIEFLRPDCYWPHPYTLEQAFGVFNWMCSTAEKYSHTKDRTYHKSGPLDLLSKKPTCINIRHAEPIISIADLRQRFHYALLSAHSSVHANVWRGENRVSLSESPMLSFPHFIPFHADYSEGEYKTRLDSLLDASGRISKQLNEYHKDAKEIVRVNVECGNGFRFVLHYGYDGSSWRHELASGDQFYKVLKEAEIELRRLREDQ